MSYDHQMVIRWYQTVIRQSLGSHQAVIRQSSDILLAKNKPLQGFVDETGFLALLVLCFNTKIPNFAWIVGKSKVLSNCAVKIQNTTRDWRQTWLTVQAVHSILTNGSFYDHLQSDVTTLLWHGLSSCCCLLLTIPRWLGLSIRWLSLNMTSLVECTTNSIEIELLFSKSFFDLRMRPHK